MAVRGSNDIFIPRNPANQTFRPLGGVRREVAGEAIPPTEFYDLRNLGATSRGPTKRGGFEIFAGGDLVDSTTIPIHDIGVVWKSDGTQFAAALTNRYLYLVGINALTPVYWPYSAGVVKSVSGTTVQFSGGSALLTATNYLTIGDVFIFSTMSAAGVTITAINTASNITISSNIGAWSAGTPRHSYVIRRVFHPQSGTGLDWTTIDQKLVVTDKTRRGMYAYNGATLGVYSPTMASLGYAPAAVSYFKDRLWTLNAAEKSGSIEEDHRHRIRWSGTTGDPRSFAATDWLDLPYAPGQGRRMLPLGNLMIAYYEDSIWYGTPTNVVGLPYRFDRVETGGVGLVASRAVTSYLGGHFFVGQDNVYYLPSDQRSGPVPIGDAIAPDTVLKCANPLGIYAVTDPKRQRILFGFPMSGSAIDEIWAYDYIAKTWSHLDYETTMLANPLIQLTLAWADLISPMTWINIDSTYPSWDSMKIGVTSNRDVFAAQGRGLQRLGTASLDFGGGAIPTRLETGDIDLGVADDDKTFTRLSVKLRERPNASVAFVTLGSEDGGNTWRNLGTLTIPTGKREGAIDFGITGSAIRFRLSSASITEGYTVSEMGYRVRLRGRETTSD